MVCKWILHRVVEENLTDLDHRPPTNVVTCLAYSEVTSHLIAAVCYFNEETLKKDFNRAMCTNFCFPSKWNILFHRNIQALWKPQQGKLQNKSTSIQSLNYFEKGKVHTQAMLHRLTARAPCCWLLHAWRFTTLHVITTATPFKVDVFWHTTPQHGILMDIAVLC